MNISRGFTALAFAGVLTLASGGAGAQTIIEEWSKVPTPPPPTVKPVKIEAGTTALLVLDLVNAGCNDQRRPRCVAALPKVEKLLNDARAHKLAVVHSLTSATKVPDILPQVAPKNGEPAVTSSVDKFMNTDLDKILKDKGIKTVIVVGTAAEGAVLYTASGAALRGYNVIVPVEGSTGGNAYAEAATARILTNAPGVSAKVTLTKMDMISY